MEAEFELLRVEEADKNPVGLGRSEPHALPEPKYVIIAFIKSKICEGLILLSNHNPLTCMSSFLSNENEGKEVIACGFNKLR